MEQGKFNIAKLIEYEQGVITGITEMTIVSSSFLFAKCRTVRTIYVEDDLFDGFTIVNLIDPFPRLAFQDFEVLGLCLNLGFKPSHLADEGILFPHISLIWLFATWKGPYNFGNLMKDSRFEGKTFTARTDYIVNGADDCFVFLSATKGQSDSDFTFTARTTDGGKSFNFLSWIVPPTDPDRGVMPTTVRCSDKKLVTAIRRRDGKARGGDNCWVDCYVSSDNAGTWSFQSRVGDTGLWNGNPPALARLKDGRLCCVYGNRSKNQMLARFSADDGAKWGQEVILRDDFQVDKFGDNDFGYPRLVQRPDGELVAIYYWATKERPHQHIVATIWKQGK